MEYLMRTPRDRTWSGKAVVSVALASVLVGLVVLLLASSSSTSDSNSSWPMLMGDAARTGGRGTVPGPGTGELLWSHSTPYSVNSPPALADSRLFLTYGGWEEGGGLDALDAQSGKLLWRQETESIHGGAVIEKAIVVIGTQKHFNSGSVTGFDAVIGDEIWVNQFESTYVVGTPAINNWSLHVSDWRWDDKEKGGLHTIKVDDGLVINSNSTLMAGSSIAIVNESTILATSAKNGVYIIDGLTNEVVWSTRIPGGGHLGPPSIRNEIVIVPTEMEGIYGLDLGTGEILWNYNIPIQLSSTVPVDNGKVIVSTIGGIHIVDVQTGNLIKKFSGPSINYVASHLGTLYMSQNVSPSAYEYDESLWYVIAVDLETGEEEWRYQLGKFTTSPPIVVDGILYQIYGDQEEVGGVVALDAGYLAAVESGVWPHGGVNDTENPSPGSGRLSPTPVSLVLVALCLSALRRLDRMK